MKLSVELDMPSDYDEVDLLNLFSHIAEAISKEKDSEDIVSYDGRNLGHWEVI